MPTYDQKRNDIGILRTDGTTYVGLMLATIDGKPAYKTSTERYLKNQYYAGAPDYGALDPQNEIAIIIDDFRSGFGLKIYDSTEPKRYYSSIGMDLRHRGMAIASWTPTTVTKPSTIAAQGTLANKTMEGGGSWTGGAQSAVQKHAGANSWRCTQASDAYQAVATWDSSWASKTFTFGCWVWADAASAARIRLYDDGGGSTYSGYHTGGSSWEFFAVTHTVNAGATSYLRAGLYNDHGTNDNCYFDDAEFGSPIVGDINFVSFNNEWYMGYGLTVSKLNAGGTAFTPAFCLPDYVTDFAVHGSYLYIAQGLSNHYWYMDTSDNLFSTNNATNDGNFYYFATVHGASPTLYGNDATNKIRSNAAPDVDSDAWSGQTTVGSSSYSITDLIAWKGALYIMKENQPHYLDDSGDVQADLAQELESAYATTSGKNAWVWKNKLYIPCGDQALLETDATTNTFRNPANYCTNLSSFVGRIFAGVGDEEWNYIAVDNSSAVEILAGREETIGGTTSWVWHPIAEMTLTGVGAMGISSKVSKRLWIGSTADSDSVYYLALPTTYGNITSDTNRYFKTDGYFITPWLHGSFKGEDKAWIKATATLGHSSDSDIYFECHYQKKGDSAWTDAGDFIGSSTNRTPTIYLPVDSDSASPVSPMMRFKLVAKTDTDTTTPILENLDVRAILKPTHRKIIECVVRCKDNILDKEGNYLEGTSAANIRTVLDEARDATWPFTFYDPWGATKYCIILPNDPESTMQTGLKDENPEQYYYLRMQEVAMS